jgi:pyruvate dehydrogenase E1 component alpha subunit
MVTNENGIVNSEPHSYNSVEAFAKTSIKKWSVMGATAQPLMYSVDPGSIISELGASTLHELLKRMLRIRHFELRAEVGYQQGKIGGFLHLYIGQEAVQTGAIQAIGVENWWSTTYRCHALALLLGESPRSLFAELYGRSTGNAHGRGGSMHLYSRKMLGGFAIVAGGLPVATGAALSCKRLKTNEISVCFFGDGACAQGVVHESLNIASMWSLPCMYVIENNKWSMGTPLCRTLTNYNLFPEKAAESYDMRYLRFDGMDLIQCYAGFKEARQHIQKTGRPILVEVLTERFRGHSISDPGLYRSKEEVKGAMERDPLLVMKELLLKHKLLTEEQYEQMDQAAREEITAAAQEAEGDPWPNPLEIEEGVFAPAMEEG